MTFFEIIFWLSAFVIVYHMLIHPLILITFSRKSNHSAQVTLKYETAHPAVDIIMPMYNESACVKQKLENLLVMDYPLDKLNIYIGLDGCTDSTRQIIEQVISELCFRQMRIVLIDFPVNRGKIKVLNDLMALGRSDMVILTDASAVMPPNAITHLVTQLQQTHTGAVSAGYKLLKPGQEGESFYWKYQSLIKSAESRLGSVIGAHGSCYAVRRQLFKPLTAETINDDFIIPMNIISQGYRVAYSTRVIAFELEGSSSTQDFTRRKRISLGNIQQVFACTDVLNPKYGWTAFNFLFGKVVRAMLPVLLALILLSSAILSSELFYQLVFITQILVYGATSVGIILHKAPSNSYLYLIFYVVSGYIAGLIGTVLFMSGKANYSWQKKQEDYE